MPNHIHNLLKFDCSQERLAEIYRALSYTGEGESDGVDFEKIIPMPATLNIESGSSTDRAVELYMTSINPAAPHYGGDKMEAPAFEFLHKAVNAQMHGRCNANLSATEIERHTQHGSEQDMLKLGEQAVTNLLRYKALTWYEWSINNWGTKWNSYDNSFDGETIAFNTAWAAPHPILQKLSEMYPDIQIEHQWADEDMGHNCGRKVYLGGKIEEEYYPESRKDALDLACEIWGSDIEDAP